MNFSDFLNRLRESGAAPGTADALALASCADTALLVSHAGRLRDAGFDDIVTYSPKVFLPLTRLCRDVCHYCTFAVTPSAGMAPYLPIAELVKLCEAGAALGCREALFTLGEKPELRYRVAREALAAMGHATTIEYVREAAHAVLTRTGLLPHINAGTLTPEEITELRSVSASMGIMLESASPRLGERGMPHFGSPDKDPAARLATIAEAGRQQVPLTTGLLIGIGETRRERVESLLALRDLHDEFGHLQELIIQNFRAKPATLMASAPEPDLEELCWTVAVARLLFGPRMSIQAPPNLSPGDLERLLAAGVNDWGGISPLTPDHVNPEAPWPHVQDLARQTAAAGKCLAPRLTIYPDFALAAQRWLHPAMRSRVLVHHDALGMARESAWQAGRDADTTEPYSTGKPAGPAVIVRDAYRELARDAAAGNHLEESAIAGLFAARGDQLTRLLGAADALRRDRVGDVVSYVVNRNINYTNVCTYGCRFCAFSRGSARSGARDTAYDLDAPEIERRCREAWARGATEVCMQGGIHPGYTGQTYLDILRTVRAATPQMHIHAFSPLEVHQGAASSDCSAREYLRALKQAGLNSLPGTAAEILHPEVRDVLCADKISAERWLELVGLAHAEGLRTTATIMFGHIDHPLHWARHLLAIRELQLRTGGITEFVPLPFVPAEAPLFRQGKARPGPTLREVLLMHAVARLVFAGQIENIQASWVKLGASGVRQCLAAGANDVGGSLMNESITRAAGAVHGEEWHPAAIESFIEAAGYRPRMRTTFYADAAPQQRRAALASLPVAEVQQARAGREARAKYATPPRAAAGG